MIRSSFILGVEKLTLSHRIESFVWSIVTHEYFSYVFGKVLRIILLSKNGRKNRRHFLSAYFLGPPVKRLKNPNAKLYFALYES